MADRDKLRSMMMILLLVVVALALTPNVASYSTDAKYQSVTEYRTVVVSTSNSTSALTYSPRNDSLTGAHILVTLNQTSFYGQTIITMDQEAHGNYTMAVNKIIVFTVPTLNATKTYNVTIAYSTIDLTSGAIAALIDIAPLIWVVLIVAIGIVAIIAEFKHTSH